MGRSIERLREVLGRTSGGADPLDPSPFGERFLAAMDDDLNTPRALASLFDLARETNRAGDGGRDIGGAQATLRHLGGILGLTFQKREALGEDHLLAKPLIELLLATRDERRKSKQFDLADRIREGLDQQGVVLEDTPQGTQWQYQPRG